MRPRTYGPLPSSEWMEHNQNADLLHQRMIEEAKIRDARVETREQKREKDDMFVKVEPLQILSGMPGINCCFLSTCARG